jgi:hypothetical protein
MSKVKQGFISFLIFAVLLFSIWFGLENLPRSPVARKMQERTEKRTELKTKADSLFKAIVNELKNTQGPLDPARAREMDQELDSMEREYDAYYQALNQELLDSY